MSLILVTLFVILVMWLFIKIFWLELPSLKTIHAMSKFNGPKGLPLLIGDAFSFIKIDCADIFDYYTYLFKVYPRITAMYLAGVPVVIIQKPNDIKCILRSNVNINKGIEYDALHPWLNDGLLTSYGNKWHLRRKLLTPTFHFKVLNDSFGGIVKNSKILAKILLSTQGTKVRVEDYVTRCTLDVITETAMGVQLNTQTDKENCYLQCVQKASDIIMCRVSKIYLMNEYLFSLSKAKRQFATVLKALHQFTDNVIGERKKAENSSSIFKKDTLEGRPKKAFLDTLLTLQKDNPDTFNDQDIREEVDTFMFEGHDTISAALCFCLWLLGSHPDIQDKAYDEINNLIGDDKISMESVNNMNYLERIIKETLRLYPSVPYMSRRLTEDVCLDDGTIIPAGANITILPYLLHQDPEIFTDPDRFDPERFTEEAQRGRHPYAYIPFSAGPRNCVGQRFAMLELKVTIASVLQQCRIESITKKQDFKILPHVIIKPTCPLECCFFPRSK